MLLWNLGKALRKLWTLPVARLRDWLAPGRPGTRVSVPTVLQLEVVECGAACLSMVLAYHGRYETLEALRVACGVSRDGSKASNVLKAARGYGLECKGFRREPKQLRDMRMPAIIHWNFNHFVVLEGFRGDTVYLNDPGYGPRRVSREEFDVSFTGVVLAFEPGPEFRPGGARRSLLGALRPRLSGSYLALLFVVLAGLALLVPGLLAPVFFQTFVDDVMVKGLHSWLQPLLLLMAVAAAVQMTLTWLRQRYLLRLETKLALSTSSKFFWHVLRLPIDFFNQRYAGEIGNRVGINDTVASLLSGELATTVLNLAVIAFYALLMIQYDALLTVVSVTVATLNLVALRWVSRLRTDISQGLIQDRGRLMGVAMSGLQTLETLKATGTEPTFFTRWAGHHAKVINSEQRLGLATACLSAVPPLLLALNTAFVLGMGGMRVIDGYLTIGMLMAYQALMLAFITPVNQLVTIGGELQEVKGDMDRLDDVLRAEPLSIQGFSGGDDRDADELADEQAAPKLAGYLELNGVAFGYNRLEPPLIRDFSLSLAPGHRVALVGGSGCGKSTVARLVAGLYDVWEGEILFDGKPRLEIGRGVMTASMGFVDQDIFLFEGTVHENLTLWDRTIPEAAVVRAARDAAIHDVVTARPHGYLSRVSEGGVNFSGGQRQRLEIARALCTNPSILVLDEATSALDPATEKEIDDWLRRRGVTCLLIAHRLSTIRDCDEIIVMDRGQIVQRGRHEELMAAGGAYSDLIAAE